MSQVGADIVERLRRDAEAWAVAKNTFTGPYVAELEREAADEIERLRAAIAQAEAAAPPADLNFLKVFWRAAPTCLGLNCDAECNPMSAHCGRAAEVFERHNAALAAAPPADMEKAVEAILRELLWGEKYMGLPAVVQRIVAITAAPHAVEREWQDISTAPKDGSTFLAVNSRAAAVGYRVVYFDDEAAAPYCWRVEDAAKGFNHHRDFFTHWQPLPAPPHRAGDDSTGADNMEKRGAK